MKKDISNEEQYNLVSAPPLLLLLFLCISFFLVINKPYTAVYADSGDSEEILNLKEVIFNLNYQKEREANGIKLITLKRGDIVKRVLTTAKDIDSLFRENMVELEDNDTVILSTSFLVDGSIVTIVRTDVILVEKLIDLPFETEIIKTTKRVIGEESIVREGVLGVMSEKHLNYYEDGKLVRSELIDSYIQKQPVGKVVEIGTSKFTLEGIEIRGYDCPYWYSVVDSGSYSDEEKRWLKFIMYCESGCNAESNKNSTYKGLFQWSTYWWSKQFSENIFDGNAQLQHTIEKYRAGESTRAKQWPACHAKYIRTFGN